MAKERTSDTTTHLTGQNKKILKPKNVTVTPKGGTASPAVLFSRTDTGGRSDFVFQYTVSGTDNDGPADAIAGAAPDPGPSFAPRARTMNTAAATSAATPTTASTRRLLGRT